MTVMACRILLNFNVKGDRSLFWLLNADSERFLRNSTPKGIKRGVLKLYQNS